MTLIIAFKGKAPDQIGGEALIFGSDSRETFGGFTINPTRKIIPIVTKIDETQVNLCIVASSGDSAISKNAVDIIEKVFKEKCARDWTGKSPTYEQFVDAMHLVEQAVVSKISYYRNSGISVDLSVLIGGVDANGKASLWEIDNRGVTQRRDDSPGFACIGSGYVLGGNLLLQQFFDPVVANDLNRGSLFVAYIIEQVSRVDPSVGPFDGELFLINKKGIGKFNKEQLPMVQDEIRTQQVLLRKLFMSFRPFPGGAGALDKEITEALNLYRKKVEPETAKKS